MKNDYIVFKDWVYKRSGDGVCVKMPVSSYYDPINTQYRGEYVDFEPCTSFEYMDVSFKTIKSLNDPNFSEDAFFFTTFETDLNNYLGFGSPFILHCAEFYESKYGVRAVHYAQVSTITDDELFELDSLRFHYGSEISIDKYGNVTIL